MPNLNFLKNVMRLKDMKNPTESKDRIDPRDMDPLKERWEIIKDELETSSAEAGGEDQMRTFHSVFIDPDLKYSHGDNSGEKSTEDNASSEKPNILLTTNVPNKENEEEATDVADNDIGKMSFDKESSEQEDLESSEINIESGEISKANENDDKESSNIDSQTEQNKVSSLAEDFNKRFSEANNINNINEDSSEIEEENEENSTTSEDPEDTSEKVDDEKNEDDSEESSNPDPDTELIPVTTTEVTTLDENENVTEAGEVDPDTTIQDTEDSEDTTEKQDIDTEDTKDEKEEVSATTKKDIEGTDKILEEIDRAIKKKNDGKPRIGTHKPFVSDKFLKKKLEDGKAKEKNIEAIANKTDFVKKKHRDAASKSDIVVSKKMKSDNSTEKVGFNNTEPISKPGRLTQDLTTEEDDNDDVDDDVDDNREEAEASGEEEGIKESDPLKDKFITEIDRMIIEDHPGKLADSRLKSLSELSPSELLQLVETLKDIKQNSSQSSEDQEENVEEEKSFLGKVGDFFSGIFSNGTDKEETSESPQSDLPTARNKPHKIKTHKIDEKNEISNSSGIRMMRPREFKTLKVSRS